MSALASAGAALAACQAAAPTPGKPAALPNQPNSGVNVVVMIYRQEFSEDDMKRFMQENPGISLEFVDLAGSAGFSAMAAAGTPPDLVRVEAPSVPQMLARQLLLDLTPYFETSKILKTDDLMPVNDYYKAESPLRVGSGSIYGMCKDFSPDLTIFINKAIFDKNDLPVDDTQSWTYAEIMDIAMKVLEKEGDRITTHGFGWEGSWIDRFWMNSLAETSLSLFSEGYDKLNLVDSEEAVMIARWYFDMLKDMLAFSAINPSPNGGIGADFYAGQLAMCQYGFWFSAMAEGETTRGKVMMMPAPHWAGQRRDVAISATGVVITSATKVADAAWKTFEYYIGGAPAVARAKSGWGVPALKSQLGMIPQETDFQKQAFKVLQDELALNTPPMQFNPYLGGNQIAGAWAVYSEQALMNEITFEEMLHKVEDDGNQAIREGMKNIQG